MTNEMSKRIAVLAGDGIGIDVTKPAISVLRQTASFAGLDIAASPAAIGGDALDRFGTPLPEETLELCRLSDAVFLGAVGGPKWDANPPELRPEKGLLGIRKGLGLYGNIRPVRQILALVDCSTLKAPVVTGVDLVVMRELTGGLYFGEPRGIRGPKGAEVGLNTMLYHRYEVERIARKAFALAKGRRLKVTSVDKANVLEVSRLWRQVVEEVHLEFPEVELNHQYVDNCAMQLVLRPSQFDVILTENTFGDILSDIGGVLTGSIGTLASASIGDGPALYEPVHGSAPDIVGRDIANPMGAIGCIAMMFELSFARPDLGHCITKAMDHVVAQGFRTKDLAQAGCRSVGTEEFGARVQRRLEIELASTKS